MNNPNTQFKVDISQTTAEICEKCEHDTFIPAFKMRKLSALFICKQNYITRKKTNTLKTCDVQYWNSGILVVFCNICILQKSAWLNVQRADLH